jgi:CheY-like chemotaxis protein
MATFRALVIDNDERSRSNITKFLMNRGLFYNIATGPKEARNMLRDGDYDLVFLDLDLGIDYNDGIEILSFMQVKEKTFPTVIYSMFAYVDDVLEKTSGFAFVISRLEPKQLPRLTGTLDKIIIQILNRKPNIRIRLIVCLISLSIAVAAAYLTLEQQILNPSITKTEEISFVLFLFATLNSLLYIFGIRIVEMFVSCIGKKRK